MDAALTKKANDLAKEFAGQATTLEELNEATRSPPHSPGCTRSDC